jgi:glycosyltransferase involved in cell wall biosynthesis
MLRLSRHHKVIYFREWSLKEWVKGLLKGKRFTNRWINHNLLIYNFVLPLPSIGGRWQSAISLNKRLSIRKTKALIRQTRGSCLILWYYFPMLLEVSDELRQDCSAIVYECMDNYMALSNNDPEAFKTIALPETRLLEKADVIFYGSRTLMHARPNYRKKSYHFPTGVDTEHFARAMRTRLPLPADIQRLKKPILGYWGAVDQRIDYAVLDYCARQRPDWSIVLIGPMVTISERDIAPFLTLTNVHWLGPKTYWDLPEYARAFDLCILPFKTTDEGKYLNPTKTLEYLATGKPVISTGIPEIEHFYSDTVAVAYSEVEFVKKSEQLLGEGGRLEQDKRLAKAKGNSWEVMVAAMENIVERTLLSRLGSVACTDKDAS